MNGLRVVVISAECAKGGKTSNRRASRYNAVRGYMVQLYAGAKYINVQIAHCGTLRNGQTKEWRKERKKKKNSSDADDDGERERFV